MRRLIWGLILSFLLPGLGFGQTAQDSWDNLKQLQPGQKIEVVDMNLKSFKGTFVDVSGEAVTLRVKNDKVSVERENVLRVGDREHSKRLRNALLGGAIGAGVGLAANELAARKAQPISEYRGEYRAIGAAILVPIGAGVGAGAGAGIPSYQTIYRARKKP